MGSVPRGFGIGEWIALAVFLVLVGALLLSHGGHEPTDPDLRDCVGNVRDLVLLLETVAIGAEYPRHSGADLVLTLVVLGELRPRTDHDHLFCPGDERELFPGEKAYRDLDLAAPGSRGHLTSYAGRDLLDSRCHVARDVPSPAVLLCDDSDDHHDGRGFVVGLSGGAVRWRDKVEDWGLDVDTDVEVGPESVVEELRCLRTE